MNILSGASLNNSQVQMGSNYSIGSKANLAPLDSKDGLGSLVSAEGNREA